MILDDSTHCLKNSYTYKDLTKPVNRDYMEMLDICSLGSQAGGFGVFNERFRVVSLKGATLINDELKKMCKEEGLDIRAVLEFAPTLSKLLK